MDSSRRFAPQKFTAEFPVTKPRDTSQPRLSKAAMQKHQDQLHSPPRLIEHQAGNLKIMRVKKKTQISVGCFQGEKHPYIYERMCEFSASKRICGEEELPFFQKDRANGFTLRSPQVCSQTTLRHQKTLKNSTELSCKLWITVHLRFSIYRHYISNIIQQQICTLHIYIFLYKDTNIYTRANL